MQRTLTALGVLLTGVFSVCAETPWGWAEGPAGRTPLTGQDIPATATNVVFAAGDLQLETLVLTNRVLSFTAAAAGTTIGVGGTRSGFDLSGAAGDWTFRGVSFRGTGEQSDLVYDGGAICCRGGQLTLKDCTFTTVASRFTGGAVSAALMDGEVVISNCTFTGNRAGPLNGMGGAVYASRQATGDGELRLTDCTFVGNDAQNGGAVATVRVIDDAERPMPLAIDGCVFRGNSAAYSGGAIDDEGDLTITNSLFAANVAAIQGGAICAGTSDPEWTFATVQIGAGSVFRGNLATNSFEDARFWTSGGAIALSGFGYALSVAGRHVVFADNRAASATSAYGGAIAAAYGTEVEVAQAALLANRADTVGGAIAAWGDRLSLSTAIFSNNTVVSTHGFGGAVSAEAGVALVMSNVTVRGANCNAVDAYQATVRIVNCVLADNGGMDVSVGGASDAALVAEYSAFGRAQVEEGTPIVTNACLSAVTAAIFNGAALDLAADSYNPVAALGLPQTALDYNGVAYGSRPAGYSMGAFECATATEIELVAVTWYHNRADGLYYPRVELRFVGGEASRIAGVTLTCGEVVCELPPAAISRLKAAVSGETLAFGVDSATFVPFAGGPENFGFVPPEQRLFGVHDAARSVSLDVAVTATLQLSEVVTVRALARSTVAARPVTVPVPAQFSDFRVGATLAGQASVAPGARVWLCACAALGDDWQWLDELELDADGRFEVAVPEGLRFFRLEAEVLR